MTKMIPSALAAGALALVASACGATQQHQTAHSMAPICSPQFTDSSAAGSASTSRPKRLAMTVQSIPQGTIINSVRFDVLASSARVTPDDSDTDKTAFAQGREGHARRFEKTGLALKTADSISFDFDGRGDDGRSLATGSYKIGYAISFNGACNGSLQGELSTVVVG